MVKPVRARNFSRVVITAAVVIFGATLRELEQRVRDTQRMIDDELNDPALNLRSPDRLRLGIDAISRDKILQWQCNLWRCIRFGMDG